MSIARPAAALPRPRVCTLRPGKRLVRVYNPQRYAWNASRGFGPIRGQRFDHHPLPVGLTGRESVWYCSGSLSGAVAEAFGRIGIVDRSCGRRICTVELTAPMALVDLFGVGPRRLGLDQRICTTTDTGATQEWARALYAQFVDLVGIRWRGRQASSENVVLTDRANLATLALLGDWEISDAAVWPRIAGAARRCSIRVV